MFDIKPIWERIQKAWFRHRIAMAYRRAEKLRAKAYRKRVADNDWFVAVIVCCIQAASISSCATVSDEIRAEQNRCATALMSASSPEAVEAERARCHSNLDRIER